MAIQVKKISVGIRSEGRLTGTIMTAVDLGQGGEEYSNTELVEHLWKTTTSRWIMVTGDNPTQTGMGTVIKGLKQGKFLIEMICSGVISKPSWLHSVDSWVIDVDYKDLTTFRFGILSLRDYDMLRFKVSTFEEAKLAYDIMTGNDNMRLFPGTRFLVCSSELRKSANMQKIVEMCQSLTRFRLF